MANSFKCCLCSIANAFLVKPVDLFETLNSVFYVIDIHQALPHHLVLGGPTINQDEQLWVHTLLKPDHDVGYQQTLMFLEFCQKARTERIKFPSAASVHYANYCVVLPCSQSCGKFGQCIAIGRFLLSAS